MNVAPLLEWIGGGHKSRQASNYVCPDCGYQTTLSQADLGTYLFGDCSQCRLRGQAFRGKMRSINRKGFIRPDPPEGPVTQEAGQALRVVNALLETLEARLPYG